jgi:hypothetical protein
MTSLLREPTISTFLKYPVAETVAGEEAAALAGIVNAVSRLSSLLNCCQPK